MMKTNEKDYLKTELFVDIFSSYVTKEYQEGIHALMQLSEQRSSRFNSMGSMSLEKG